MLCDFAGWSMRTSSMVYPIQGRLLASFQDDAKYEHVGQDTRSQSGKDDKSAQKDKDLKISDEKTKSKDNDKSSRSKITKHEGTSLQQDKDQDKDKSLTTKAISLISRRSVTLKTHFRGDVSLKILEVETMEVRVGNGRRREDWWVVKDGEEGTGGWGDREWWEGEKVEWGGVGRGMRGRGERRGENSD
ncbi:hypothetical protein Tco_0481281 [Tanacetum coccineum]